MIEFHICMRENIFSEDKQLSVALETRTTTERRKREVKPSPQKEKKKKEGRKETRNFTTGGNTAPFLG